MMGLRNIDFNVECDIPIPEYPPITLVLATSLRHFVTASDNICIRGNTEGEATADDPHFPSIAGGIISIKHTYNEVQSSISPLHPHILLPLSNGLFILLQYTATRDQLIEL